MRKNKTYSRACQRAEKPDELVMIALNNESFAKRFVKEFKKAKGVEICPQQK